MITSLFAAVLCLVFPAMGSTQGREWQPLPKDQLEAVLTFFAVDSGIPLDAHVVELSRHFGFVREKIVFTGARGTRVPAYLAYPDSGQTTHPLVLLLHAGASSKDAWWQTDSYDRGGWLTRKLLSVGYAVFALDAQNHGERAGGIDYVPIPTLYFKNKWWASFRAMVVETAADHIRGLQYLASRPEIDLRRIATVGQSMGAFTSFYLAALDSRITTLVVGSPALTESWLYPLTAINFAPTIKARPVLVLTGDKDQLIPRHATDRLVAVLGKSARLQILASDHRLPAEYIDIAVRWLQEHLSR
jgi:dienelactone hydrolase